MLLECQSKFHLEAQLTSDSNLFKTRSTNLNLHNEKFLIDLKLHMRQKNSAAVNQKIREDIARREEEAARMQKEKEDKLRELEEQMRKKKEDDQNAPES
jgi:hypothetical protein